jgi:CTP:molybdopterin cytidylyltransferase MocA
MRPPEPSIAAIVLAAGQSARMGVPKQLLPYGATHLLGHAILSAADAGFSPVHVVLGCHADLIAAGLSGFAAHVVINQEWRDGMASSIRCGLASVVRSSPECEAVLLTLCDQPTLGVSHLRQLLGAWLLHPRYVAVASSHLEVLGAPAIFGKELFPELRNLSGSEGARRLLECHRAEVVALRAPEMMADIDTLDDYRKLQRKW